MNLSNFDILKLGEWYENVIKGFLIYKRNHLCD